MSISVLVVLYNSAVNDVPVLRTALRSQQVSDIVVCDNSDRKNDNAEQAACHNITYISMNGNKGLSKAYNVGVIHCRGDIVCVFDDDTLVDEDYFNAVTKLAESSRKWDIALPIVMAGNKVLSPSHFKKYRTVPVDPSHIGDMVDLTGINSGMAVKRSLYNQISYDSNLFLDLIDHQFILDARGVGGSIVVLKGPRLHQSYSLESDSQKNAKKRLEIFENDAKYFYSTSFISKLYCRVMLLRRKLKLCIQYKTFSFL